MQITVEFLSLPIVTRVVGSRTVTLSFPGGTVDDLITAVACLYGPRVREFLLSEDGRLDHEFRVQLNDSEWIHEEQRDRPLVDGDKVTLMMLVGGG